MLCILYIIFVFLASYTQNFCQATALIGKNVRHAKKEEFPFIVSLSWKNPIKIGFPEKNHICGGTLITRRHVLTAAHCFRKLNCPNQWRVKVGSRDLQEGVKYKIKRWITYDQWVGNEDTNGTDNDLAVVKLEKSVSSRIKPATLTSIPVAQLYGKKVVTAGWGLLEKDARPRYLQTGELNVLEPQQCLHVMREYLTTPEIDSPMMFLCTSADPPVKITYGDSGSPLLIEGNQIIAVTKGFSFRKRNESILHEQNLHLSINYYKTFINDVLQCRNQKWCL